MQKIDSAIQFKGRFKLTLKDFNDNIIQEVEKENLVVTAGKQGFAKIINSESGFSGVPNYCAVGTGTNTPAVTDTQLQTELAREVLTPGTTSTRIGAEVDFEFYFGPTEANGNIKEVGVFVDGTATANSGTLFDRTLVDITKTSDNSLTIAFALTVL